MKSTRILLSLLIVAGLASCSSDDPLTVSFTKASQTAAESAGTATITAALSVKSDKDVSVPFTVTGTAVDPDDYTITTSPLTIKAGDTSAKITITLVNDHVTESNETIIVTMGTPVHAEKGKILISKATISNTAVPALASQLVTDSGDIYIADTYNCAIRKVSHSTGFISTVAGDGVGTCGDTGEGGLATAATLNYPTAIAVDSDENIYIADTNNSKIKKVAKSDGKIHTIAGDGTMNYSGDGGLATAAQIARPLALLLNRDGDLIIADTYNDRVRIITFGDGKIDTIAGTGNNGMGILNGDGGLATAADLSRPASLALDTFDNLYFGEISTNVVRKIDSTTGKLSTVVGTGTSGSTGDGGLATAALIDGPFGLVFDENNNMLVSDGFNDVVRKVNKSDGKINTIAGTLTVGGYSGDTGDALSATLHFPGAVTIDANGDIYIYDSRNSAVRKVNATTNIITTVAGDGTSGYSGDGAAATSAQLKRPSNTYWWWD